jgi:hypothetical protein
MEPSALDKILRSFTGLPVGPVPTVEDWASIEKSIGRAIPKDYKAIMERTGGESIGHCWPHNPAERENICVAFSHAVLVREQILTAEMAMEKLKIELYPEPGGWIQLAKLDDTDFMLRPTGDDIVIADYGSWELHQPGMTFSELMWAMFEDRELFDGLGASNWRNSKEFFGIPGLREARKWRPQ